MTHHRAKFAAPAAIVSSLVCLTGCGGAGSAGVSPGPEGTVEAFYNAFLAGDINGACALTADEALRTPTSTSPEAMADCERYWERAFSASELAQLLAGKQVDVAKATIQGDVAMVADADVTVDGVPLPDQNSASVRLINIDGSWYITDFG